MDKNWLFEVQIVLMNKNCLFKVKFVLMNKNWLFQSLNEICCLKFEQRTKALNMFKIRSVECKSFSQSFFLTKVYLQSKSWMMECLSNWFLVWKDKIRCETIFCKIGFCFRFFWKIAEIVASLNYTINETHLEAADALVQKTLSRKK